MRDYAGEVEQTGSWPKSHLLISGTGRAGTSFLVRYLAAMGLETHLQLHGDAQWSEEANAGFEDMPIAQPGVRLPYVIKSPWLCEIVDAVLANPSMHVDGVIIPMRDLSEAVTSRIVLERQAIHRQQVADSRVNQIWESWSYTPGGIVFSLNPIDQGRLLAVWFHRLVERLTKADIPIILLSFPRLAEDADYLFHKLSAFLPESATLEASRELHRCIADQARIRVGHEFQKSRATDVVPFDSEIAYPERAELDRLAVDREITRLKKSLGLIEAKAQATENERLKLAQQLDQITRQKSNLEDKMYEQSSRLVDLEGARAEAASQREAILGSLSWRVTRPFRAIAKLIRRTNS